MAASSTDTGPFPVGALVRLHGLQSRPLLNDRMGTILGPPIPTTGRYPVRVSFEKLLLRRENLAPTTDAAPPATAPDTGAAADAEEETEYVFVSLEGAPEAQGDFDNEEEIILEGLLTDAPRVTIGGVPYVGEYDEDIGSTLYFDRSRLQQVADGQDRALNELRERPADDEQALVAVSSKRLKFA